MSSDILMPALSPTMTHGHLVAWKKNPGDVVESGDILAEIETDKAIMEVEASDEGILGDHLVAEGTQDVEVGTCLAQLYEEGESREKAPKATSSSQPSSSPQSDVGTKVSLEESVPNLRPESAVSVKDASCAEGGNGVALRVAISPLARRQTQAYNMDIRVLKGTGPRGRIVLADVEAHHASLEKQKAETAPQSSLSTDQDVVVRPLTSMRRIIADRLTVSKQTIPHFYLRRTCRMDALMTLREDMNAHLDHRISVTDFMVKICGIALKKHEAMRHTWKDTTAMQYDPKISVSLAVAIKGGLVTPVITQVHEKNITTLSQNIKDLVARARDQKLKPQELQGGTFSLSNLGMYGVEHFDAIIPPGQSSILALGGAVMRPINEGPKHYGGMSFKPHISLSLSVDHRVIDGADAAEFLGTLAFYIENPSLIFVA